MAKHGQSLVGFHSHYTLFTSEVGSLLRYSRFAAERNPLEYHREYTAAFVMCLIIVSGSRAIEAYLSRLVHQIHHDLDLFFPMDKAVSDAHAVRIAMFPSCVADMFIDYAAHLRRLVRVLFQIGELELAAKFQALLDSNVCSEQQPIDYFSIIDPFMNHQPLRISDIENVLGPRWPIRIEEARGQYIRFMSENGAPVFLVRQQSGHQSTSYPFFGVRNQYTVYEFRRDFIEYADLYAREVGVYKCK